MRTMNDLSLHFLQDIYDAEKRGLRSMQRMARAASDQHLKDAILQHRDQSDAQITRLEQVFELTTGKRPRGKTCAAMVGLLKEVEEAIGEAERGPVLDAALIACAQAIEHYEIARYGAMVAWARQAGNADVAGLLHETLEEEKASDVGLSQLAERLINPKVPEDDAPPPPEPSNLAKTRRGPAKAQAQAAAPPEEPAPAKMASPKVAKATPAKATTAKGAPAKTASEETTHETATPAKRGRKPAAPPPEPMAAPKRRGRPPAVK